MASFAITAIAFSMIYSFAYLNLSHFNNEWLEIIVTTTTSTLRTIHTHIFHKNLHFVDKKEKYNFPKLYRELIPILNKFIPSILFTILINYPLAQFLQYFITLQDWESSFSEFITTSKSTYELTELIFNETENINDNRNLYSDDQSLKSNNSEFFNRIKEEFSHLKNLLKDFRKLMKY